MGRHKDDSSKFSLEQHYRYHRCCWELPVTAAPRMDDFWQSDVGVTTHKECIPPAAQGMEAASRQSLLSLRLRSPEVPFEGIGRQKRLEEFEAMMSHAAIAAVVLCLQGAKGAAAPSVDSKSEASGAASSATATTFPEVGGYALRRHHLGLSVGTSVFRERDELASPLAYQGLLFGGSLSYEYRGDRNDHWTYLGAGGGSLKAAIASGAYPPGTHMGVADSAYANLRYGYHRVIHRRLDGRLDLSAGVVLDLASHVYKPSGADDLFWLTTYSLDVGVMARYEPTSRHSLVARLFSPFVTYLSRTAWSIYDNSTQKVSLNHLLSGGQTKVTSLSGYRSVTARFDYAYRFSARWSGTASYELTYRNSAISDPIQTLQNSILLGLSVGI
jgi:hypothetical protein